jgi:hypothetical protein
VGWPDVKFDALTVAEAVAKTGKTPNVPTDPAGDLGGDPAHDTDDEVPAGKLIGMRFEVKVGDVLQGTLGFDGDYSEGRIVSVCEHGVFLESVEDHTIGEVFGSTWEGLLVHPEAEAGEPVAAA